MIVRNSIQETTGTDDNVAQSFYQNIFFFTTQAPVLPSIFETPQYTTIGGTKDYYGQNPLAIFTNLVKPFIRFDFTENASSFGPNVYIKHDIYRVGWEVFNAASQKSNIKSDEEVKKERVKTETIEETDRATGLASTKTIKTTTSEEENTVVTEKNEKTKGVDSFKQSKNSSARNSLTGRDEDVESMRRARAILAGQGITSNQQGSTPSGDINNELLTIIQQQLIEPIHSITASTTGITTNIYDLEIEQYTKNLGEYKTELFQDRAQYIIDTNFIFQRESTPGLTDLKIIESVPDGINPEGGYQVVSEPYKNSITTQTRTPIENIIEGEYAGLAFVAGEYFSYFEVPNKPILEYPTATGQIETFTPEIFWTNGEEADSYLVQVNYNTGDTEFSGTVFTYIVPKSDDFKEDAHSKSKSPDSEFSAKKTIRKYQMSLKSNKCLLYRVGNVKEMSNIFGVRQSVVTFSDNRSICTQTEPIKTFVYTENDSPYTNGIAGFTTPPSLDSESPLAEYILSGTVIGSIVSGATMQLIYPNASYITKPTDIVGGFSFDSLEAGTYTLNTTYRGYAADSRQIVIGSDEDVFVEIQIRWDNEFDIWAIKESDTIKY